MAKSEFTEAKDDAASMAGSPIVKENLTAHNLNKLHKQGKLPSGHYYEKCNSYEEYNSLEDISYFSSTYWFTLYPTT